MKNILVDMHRIDRHPYNGLYSFSRGLGQALTELHDSQMQFYYYLGKRNFNFFGDSVRYLEHRSIDKLFRFGTTRFDLWHITTTLSWYRPFNSKTKIVYNLHDLGFLIEDPHKPRVNNKWIRHIQKRVDRADHIIAISHFVHSFTRQYLDFGDKPVTVIHNGVDTIDYPGFETPRYRPPVPFLFSIGQLHPRKNFHVLPALLTNNNYELVIAGLNDFPYRDEILEEATRFGVADRVKLIGPVSDEEKYWYHKHCEAFLFPSIAEGFGLPVIESMRFGKPVFCSSLTSLPEVAGDYAYYFESFEPAEMRKVFGEGMHHYQTSQAPEAIIKYASQFTWQRAAAEYHAIYQKMLGL